MSKFKHHSHFPKEKQLQAPLAPHVCFRCRKSFKRPASGPPKPCPQCGDETVGLNRKFSAPKMDDLEQWKKVEFLVAHGFLFQPVYEKGEDGGYYTVGYPASLAEAEDFVEKFQSQAVFLVDDR